MGSKKQAVTDIFVSTVIPVDERMNDCADYVRSVSKILNKHYTNYEILVVDNGLHGEQLDSITKLLKKVACVRIIRLSRKHTHDTAVFAGLEGAIGDYVCVLNPLLDPPSILVEIININRAGYDVVQGVSSLSFGGPRTVTWGRRLFYWYNRKFTKANIPSNATYLLSFNRRAINALTNTNRNHRHIRHLSSLIGFKHKTFAYEPHANPRNDRKLRTGLLEALEIVTSYSAHPLRVITWLGVIAGAINMLYAVYVVLVKIFKNSVAEGWTALSLQISVMFFFLFAILVILSEYIGRILTESRKEPPYHIMEEFTSTVAVADEARRNITY